MGRIAALSLIVLANSLNGCQTPEPLAPAVIAEASHANSNPLNLVTTNASECPARARPCDEEWNPTKCTAASYQSDALILNGVLVAWGDNACLAQERLRMTACDAGLTPSLMSGISCIPDVSRGRCSTDRQACSGPEEASFCTVSQYGKQKFSFESAPAGWGKNECEARLNLQDHACRMNLDPLRLGEILCQRDQTRGECPPKTTRCPGETHPTTCSLTHPGQNTPWMGRGRSRCEAEAKVIWLACLAQVQPSTLGAMDCEP